MSYNITTLEICFKNIKLHFYSFRLNSGTLKRIFVASMNISVCVWKESDDSFYSSVHQYNCLVQGIGSSKLFTELQEQFNPTLNTIECLYHSNPSPIKRQKFNLIGHQ